MKRKLSLVLFLAAVILLMMACTIFVGGPDYPADRIPVSTQAVGELQSAIQTAVAQGMESGQLALVSTEPQLTSYLANQLEKQSKPFITDPQVALRNGQITIYGTAKQGYFQATINITLSAGVDDQGQLKIELTSADFGPLPVPKGLKDIVTAMVEEAYTGSIGPAATGIRLTSITIADGTMTIVGQTK